MTPKAVAALQPIFSFEDQLLHKLSKISQNTLKPR
jgi:hypothetical protein